MRPQCGVRRNGEFGVITRMTDTRQALPALSPRPPLDQASLAELERAVRRLEEEGFADRVAGLLGRVTGGGVLWARRFVPGTLLSEPMIAMAQDAASMALRAAVTAATWGLDRGRRAPEWLRTASVVATGAVGGAAGLAGTLAELPATTTLLLREIARIAAEEGEDLATEEARAECLAVFALGGLEGEGGYYAARIALAEVLGGAAGLALRGTTPSLLAAIASRFSIPVAWKAAGQAVPLAGAAAGAALNTLFMQHFRGRARGHFTVRRLERRHGTAAVQTAYAQIRDRLRPQPAAS
jgi:hypothetical protein